MQRLRIDRIRTWHTKAFEERGERKFREGGVTIELQLQVLRDRTDLSRGEEWEEPAQKLVRGLSTFMNVTGGTEQALVEYRSREGGRRVSKGAGSLSSEHM